MRVFMLYYFLQKPRVKTNLDINIVDINKCVLGTIQGCLVGYCRSTATYKLFLKIKLPVWFLSLKKCAICKLK